MKLIIFRITTDSETQVNGKLRHVVHVCRLPFAVCRKLLGGPPLWPSQLFVSPVNGSGPRVCKEMYERLARPV